MSVNRKGQIARRADVATDFNSDVRNVIDGKYVWTSSNHPAKLTQNVWGGALPTMSANNISGGTMTASTLISNDYCQTISGVTLGISRGEVIKQPNFSDLMSRWESLCNNTVTFTVNTHTQHSNHSDRSRR